MKLSEALTKGKEKYWVNANIRKNPSSTTQWFVMLADKYQRPHMLVDDQENPIVHHDLNYFSDLLKKIHVREFTVFL
ncbi:hypothetical protein KO528_02035 [Saccharophagus degradans]|uniref:Uncharacterized protein n=1 Tax=Saccharophagus degradans TaxID=86304 RepID=A0AAW7X9W8_9GAMM|nr:hypothetical protein [Saccharophagus degradans]MBU2984118.1 hypothetical protein [Saccharophagus degradans]MDO6424224.1 hypothetical protein [Saccharophagus degradans]MDO6608271.1 hypothetical protein [Saccharophagus degradans]WGO96799.1 hypothetical protein QFX18_12155 [Saccharophagus degradans]